MHKYKTEKRKENISKQPEMAFASKLILEDGTVFNGFHLGARLNTSGEIVFNTGMVGYPESMTDPSYFGEILCFTYPLIGNYGIPDDETDEFGLHKNFESGKIHVKGIIISDYSKNYSHWSSAKSLDSWMKENNVPGIYGIDTRELTKKLRTKGTMLGKIIIEEDIPFYDPNKENLVSKVSIKEPILYEPRLYNKKDYDKNNKDTKKVLLIDCGCKNNIIKNLLKRDVAVIRVPWDYNFHDFSAKATKGSKKWNYDERYDYDGILISNGPGDPKTCIATIKNIKKEIEKDKPKPIFGICLGNQILALAGGGNTYKLKFGHRSQNQPCIETETKRCYITSQNHGYAVDIKTLKNEWKEWFINANDGTNEGIKHKTKPFISVQFHPEATAGPTDTNQLFDKFLEML
jgi:carbamoyl-phosphate synthase small subunit